MNLENQIQEFIIDNVPDKDNKPDNFTVEFPSECIWDVDNNQDIVIVANWRVKAPDNWTMDMKDDKRYIYIDKSEDLYSTILSLLLDQYDNIDIRDDYTELSGLSLKPSPTYHKNYSPEWSNQIQDMYTIMMCKNYREIDSKDQKLIDKTVDVVQNKYGEKNIDEDNFNNIVLYFSDFHINRLSSFKIYLETPNPHIYYSNVNTLEEYLSKAFDDPKEFTGRDTYEVFIRLGLGVKENRRENIPDEIINMSEELMQYRMDNVVNYNTSYSLEGESIILDGKHSESGFWIRQNI